MKNALPSLGIIDLICVFQFRDFSISMPKNLIWGSGGSSCRVITMRT
jgi:hypothetical protein